MNAVKIVAMTKPLIEGIETPEEFLVYTARVSNPSNQMNTLTAPKLINYMLTHKHFSPFEMVNIVFEVNTTRDIARQILRHKTMSFQEFSQRYADPGQLGFIYRDARLQDTKNRQNSIELTDKSRKDQYIKSMWKSYQTLVINQANEAYDWAIENGIAKEVARAVFPEGLTSSRLYINGNLRSLIHYIQVRYHPDTQKEHRDIAFNMYLILNWYFPSLSEYFSNIINDNFKTVEN